MTERQKLLGFYCLSALFIALNCFFLSKNILYFNFFPFVILILLLALFSLDKLMMLTVFFTPLSVNFEDLLGKHLVADVNIPTEPIMFGMMILFLLKVLQQGYFDNNISRHPVTIAIVINLLWLFITSITSTLPLISFKFLLARLWFVVTFYFMATQLFKQYENISKFIWMYIIPLTMVIGYTMYFHSKHGFDEKSANWVVDPFYNDHTAYAAILAMFFPFLVGFIFRKKYSFALKLTSLLYVVLFILAIVFSYTRGAWVSLAGAIGMLLFLAFRVKFKYLLMLFVLAVIGFFTFQTQIVMSLEGNRQDASKDFAEHIESISNISSDASNLERLNRWNCAIRMFKQKPVVGWGPGTYSFKYAPFQKSDERTIISTNMGDGGNAHSEYLGPLAESGVLGMVTVVLLMLTLFWTAFRVYLSTKNKDLKLLVACVALALTTYFVHGILNNFLDTDKASVPFWGMAAILVTADVYHNKIKEEELPEPTAK